LHFTDKQDVPEAHQLHGTAAIERTSFLDERIGHSEDPTSSSSSSIRVISNNIDRYTAAAAAAAAAAEPLKRPAAPCQSENVA